MDGYLLIPLSYYHGNYYADNSTLNILLNRKEELFSATVPTMTISQTKPILADLPHNVAGMMLYPGRIMEKLIGGTDGRLLLQSLIEV